MLRVNRRRLFSGLVSGPLLGGFGAWARQRAPDLATAGVLVTGLLLVLEPVVIVAAGIIPGWRQVIDWTLNPGPYLAEAILGTLLPVLARHRYRTR